MKKYKACWSFRDEILEVDIINETEHYVVMPAKKTQRNTKSVARERKISESHEYHDSWEAARTALLSRAERNVQSQKKQLDYQISRLNNIKAMKNE